jgi:1-acyl-sn-glycerol-3-phosphate acyltransferase
VSAKLVPLRDAARAVEAAGRRRVSVVRLTIGRLGFPYRAPATPLSVEKPAERGRTGADFDTAWARRPAARRVRRTIVEGPLRAVVKILADPRVQGVDRLADLTRLGDDAPAVIFVANHHSHLDAPLMLTAIPQPWRAKLVVGAAADYFFGTRLTGTASALVLNAFPIDRTSVNRRSSDLAAALIGDGWSLVIFPEGGRSPDGWGQPFKGGAAFLADKCGVPVVPVHLDGTGAIWGKGQTKLKPGSVTVTFGAPLRQRDGENVRRFGDRIERAVAELGDESLFDWWTARRRAAGGATPKLTGPDATGWRRAWALGEHRRHGAAARRRRQKRRWPKL